MLNGIKTSSDTSMYNCEGLFYYTIINEFYGDVYIILKFDNKLFLYDTLEVKNEEVLKKFENYAQGKIPREIIDRVKKRFLKGNVKEARS